MKKSLLLATSVAVAASASMQAAVVTEPMVKDNLVITGISSNAKWAASSEESAFTFTILNLETGETWVYSADETGQGYSCGRGKYISDTGVIVGSQTVSDFPAYWENGEWNILPLKSSDWGGFANAITPDGLIIVGMASRTSFGGDGTGTVPVLWYRNDNGTYDDYVELPYPHKDWTGRAPQYVLADDINAEGTVIALDIVDYSGMAHEAGILRINDSNDWEYAILHPELVNPKGLEFPEYPGEGPEEPGYESFMTPEELEAYNAAMEEYYSYPTPEQTDFMTEEELAAYNAAMQAYYEDWENNPFPFLADFMTEEELEAYNAAVDEFYSRPMPDPLDYMTEDEAQAYAAAMAKYEEEYATWSEAYMAFSDVLYDVLADPEAISYIMNTALISSNGQYYMISYEEVFEDPDSYFGFGTRTTPMVFNLADDTYHRMNRGIENVIGTGVFDGGQVLGATPADSYDREAVFASSPEAELVSLRELLRERDSELYAWTEANMPRMGTPVATPDLSVIASWTFNSWASEDDYEAPMYYSYILPVKGLTAIKHVGAEDQGATIKVALDREGLLTIAGDAASVVVYDLGGRIVFSAQNPGTTVNTGLKRGAYIVKAQGRDGKQTTLKTIF